MAKTNSRYRHHNPLVQPLLFTSTRGQPLGAYRVITEVSGVKLAEPVTVRDRAQWAPGSRITSASGRVYVVGERGELRREKPKKNARDMRWARRALTRALRGADSSGTGGMPDAVISMRRTLRQIKKSEGR